HTDGVANALGEQSTASDGRVSNAGAVVQFDHDGRPGGKSKSSGGSTTHTDASGTSSVHTTQSSDSTGVARARGTSAQESAGASDAARGLTRPTRCASPRPSPPPPWWAARRSGPGPVSRRRSRRPAGRARSRTEGKVFAHADFALDNWRDGCSITFPLRKGRF